MGKNKKIKTVLEDVKVNIKIKLSALWASLIFFFIYGDIFYFYKAGQLESVMAGNVGPFQATQYTLVGLSLFMAVPFIMVFLSLVLKPNVNKWTNIIIGILYLIANAVSAFTDSMAFFIIYGVLESAILILIIVFAFRWPKVNAKN